MPVMMRGPGTCVGISTLENWLWELARFIRGPLDAPDYKDHILPASSSAAHTTSLTVNDLGLI